MFGILYTFDNNEHAFEKFSCSLRSILKNTKSLDDVEINVLIPKDNSHIKEILNIYDKIKFIYNEDVNNDIKRVYDNIKNKGRWGKQVFFKLHIFNKDFYNKFDKCAYLDTDIIIRKDIHLFFNQQFNDKAIIGLVREFINLQSFINSFPVNVRKAEWVSHTRFINSLSGIEENFKDRKDIIYGNAGVILLNTKNIKNDIFEQFVYLSKKNPDVLYNEQDILNIFLSIQQNKEFFYEMPERYNRRWNFKDEDVIRHYTGNRKMEL